MNSTIKMTDTFNRTGGRPTTHSNLLHHWSPTRDPFPTRDHYSSNDGGRPNKRQRHDVDRDYPRQRDAPTSIIQNRALARLKSSSLSAVSRGSTGSSQSRSYNPNDPNYKKSRSRADFEILEIRDCPLPRMTDISASICCRFPKEEFHVGTIIKAPIHEEDFKWTPRPFSGEASETVQERGIYSHSGMSTPKASYKNERHVTFSNWNDPIYTEVRFMIVIALFYDHYLAIPLYTHGGNGLAHKGNKWEYASIQDHREPRSLKEAGTLLHTEYLKPDLSRKYTLPVAPQGFLREESKVALLKLFTQYMLGSTPE